MSGQSQKSAPGSVLRGGPGILLAVGLGLLAATGCADVRDYKGTWTGTVVSSTHLRRGFDSGTPLTITLTRIDKTSIEGRVTIPASAAGLAAFTDAELQPLEAARNDVLGELTFAGDPLATYLYFIAPDDPAEEHALVLVSAHAGERLELRVLRHDLYGIFRLSR